MTAPLAEVVEEGRELRSLYEQAVEEGLDSTANLYWDQLCEFFDEHGPRLLAVAEAAVEMRRVYDYAIPILFEGPGGTAAEIEADTMISEVDAAFDAAARGEK